MSAHYLEITEELQNYLASISLREPEALREIRDKTKTHPCAKMLVPPEEGQFLAFLIQLLQVEKALELGVFTGYSATAVALALPGNGKLYALDRSREWTSRAVHFWEKAGIREKIELRIGEGIDLLQQLVEEGHEGSFDFAFIDADKKNYCTYFEQALSLLKPHGVMLIDNVLLNGKIIDSSNNEKQTVAVRALNQHLHHDSRIDLVMLPVWDGVTLIRKRA
jgi:predicted O-methyltransferase YrrM